MKKCKYYFYFWCSVVLLLLITWCSFSSQGVWENLGKEVYCIWVGNSTLDTHLRLNLLQEKFDYWLDAEDISRTPNYLLPKEIQESLGTIISYFKYLIQQRAPSNGNNQSIIVIDANNMYNNCMNKTPMKTIESIYNHYSDNDVIKYKSINEKLFCLWFIEWEAEIWIDVRRQFVDFVNNYGDSALFTWNVSNPFIDNYISELNSEESISRALSRCLEYVDSIWENLMSTKLWLYSE